MVRLVGQRGSELVQGPVLVRNVHVHTPFQHNQVLMDDEPGERVDGGR